MASPAPAPRRAMSHGGGPQHPSLLQATPMKNLNLNNSLQIPRPLTFLRNVGFKPLRRSWATKHSFLLKEWSEFMLVIIQKLSKLRAVERSGLLVDLHINSHFSYNGLCLLLTHVKQQPFQVLWLQSVHGTTRSRSYGYSLCMGQRGKRGVLC